MSTSRLRVLGALLALVGAWCAATPARAQFALGQQRTGTASATFLKIAVGARATALGESFVAVANDPTAIYWNPAGLASLQRQEVTFSHIEWPADVRYEHIAYVLPVKRLGGSLAFQLSVLSTEIDETTELQPFGTGRSFFYSDQLIGAAYARRWTDKLLVGVGLKYMREDLGSDVGGPTMGATLFDIGSIYYLGLGSVRIATSLSNFGSQLQPGGTYVVPGEQRSYDSFDSPTMFRYGLAFEAIERADQRLTYSLEIDQPADNQQDIKSGIEWGWKRAFALRSGYNFNADALKFSAGAGFVGGLGSLHGEVDYAYTDGGPLGAVHRVSLGVRF